MSSRVEIISRGVLLLSHLQGVVFGFCDCDLKFAHSSTTTLEFSVARYRTQPWYLKIDTEQASLPRICIWTLAFSISTNLK